MTEEKWSKDEEEEEAKVKEEERDGGLTGIRS